MKSSFTGWLLATTLLIPLPAAAVPLFTFTSPDAPLPASPGDGLNGEIWTGVDVDTLAAARTIVTAGAPNATFTSTSVDYPNGSTGSVSTTTLFNTALGSDATSLSNPLVGTTAVLNSIMRFSGFLRVDTVGSLSLGLGSDDGSELVIQGTQVINNDGIHAFPGPGAGPVEIGFTSAGLYELDILFFESQVSQWGIEFFQNSAGTGMTVPQRLLYTSSTPVPEPGMFGLLGVGLLLMFLSGRRRAA